MVARQHWRAPRVSVNAEAHEYESPTRGRLLRVHRTMMPSLLFSLLCCSCSGGGGGSGRASETGRITADATVTVEVPDGADDVGAMLRDVASLPPSFQSNCSPGCSPPCAPPYDTCAVFPELGGSCYHVVQFSNGLSSAECRPADAAAASPPLNPPVYCAFGAGSVDAAATGVGAIEVCTYDYAECVVPSGAPGWQCCQVFGNGGGTQFACSPPDGGVFPLYFPPALDPDAGSDADGAMILDAPAE